MPSPRISRTCRSEQRNAPPGGYVVRQDAARCPPIRSMAPGPNLCRFERISAERQTWRVGARQPRTTIRGFRVSAAARRVGAAGAVAAAAFEPAEVDRVVQVDV